ncbi:hypothetical protein MJ588_02345 [Klebsiella pneumoniae]|nr:hypothetical protein MJ588_02345 [Klebsiella pneumoniae]
MKYAKWKGRGSTTKKVGHQGKVRLDRTGFFENVEQQIGSGQWNGGSGRCGLQGEEAQYQL